MFRKSSASPKKPISSKRIKKARHLFMALLAVLALSCRKSDDFSEIPDDTGANLPDYLQSIISIIIRSAAFIPAEPMDPRLRMVFSTSSSMMPSVEGMHVPRSASTAD